MAKPAGKIVSLTELRFKPANSNDAARAILAHHFVNVPRCSFAKDDGISQYLGSETGMDTFPAAPDSAAPQDSDVPPIQSEAPEAFGGLRRKLMRNGFATSVFLHAVAAIAVGYATLSLPDEPPMEEGITSVTLVVEGSVDARAAGAEEEVKEPEDVPVELEAKPVEKLVEAVKPVPATTETILKDVPLPMLGADLPEILTAKQETEAKMEVAAKPVPSEEKVQKPIEEPTPIATEKAVERKPVEKQPEEKPKPAEKKPEAKKEEPKKQPEKKEPEKKEKPKEKRRQNKGNQGDQASSSQRGDVDSSNKGRASTNSRGDSSNREIGTAGRTNYPGLVNKKLSRVRGRFPSPARGAVKVQFTILANGNISGLRISKSSGKDAVDATALKIVKAAVPFPPIPPEARKTRWLMTVEMNFRK